MQFTAFSDDVTWENAHNIRLRLAPGGRDAEPVASEWSGHGRSGRHAYFWTLSALLLCIQGPFLKQTGIQYKNAPCRSMAGRGYGQIRSDLRGSRIRAH